MKSGPGRLFLTFVCMAIALPAQTVFAQERMTPAIWIDPDGCEHWVIDDGAEGYMSPHLMRDGRPVCHTKSMCGSLPTDVLFAFNSDELSAPARSIILNVFRQNPSRAFVIFGHTDNVGSDEFNMDLSERRARKVADVAKANNVPISDVIAYGERWPKKSNATEAGRKENRRVEIQCLSRQN